MCSPYIHKANCICTDWFVDFSANVIQYLNKITISAIKGTSWQHQLKEKDSQKTSESLCWIQTLDIQIFTWLHFNKTQHPEAQILLQIIQVEDALTYSAVHRDIKARGRMSMSDAGLYVNGSWGTKANYLLAPQPTAAFSDGALRRCLSR